MNTSKENKPGSNDIVRVAVVVLNWNRSQDTVDCVSCILGQSFGNFDLYLCDNGSRPEEVAFLKENLPADKRLIPLFFDANLGFTGAHNRVYSLILQRDYQWLALINNDAFAEKDWLHNLLTCAEETGAAMVSSKMIRYFDPERMDNAGHFMLNTGEIMPIGHGSVVGDYNSRFENIGPCAGAALYSMEMLKITGFFDSYFDTGYEDAELGIRSVACGFRSVFEPSAIVRHKMGASLKSVIGYKYLLRIQTNIFYSWIKIMPLAVIVLNIPFMLFKLVSMVLIDIIFLRWRFLKMIFHSHFQFLFCHLRKAVESRRAFRKIPAKRISWYQWCKRHTFFLLFDMHRFYKYILSGNPSQYEQYRS